MIEARKATFSDKWPHETKKGWKCKTKQVDCAYVQIRNGANVTIDGRFGVEVHPNNGM